MPIRDGKLLHGQQYRPEDDISVPFTQQMRDVEDADAMVGDGGTEIVPHDAQNSEVRVYDLAATIAAYLATYLLSPTTISLAGVFPPTLTSITVTADITVGNGSNFVTGNGAAVGSNCSLSLSPHSASNSSASIMPDIQPNTQDNSYPIVSAQELLFFIATNPTEVDILTKATLLGVPVSTTVTITIATPAVVTWNANPLANGDTVMFSTTGVLPTGLSAGILYYVINQATNTFRISLTSGGSAINTTGAQSGTHSIRRGVKRWPVFKPKAHSITLVGRSVDLSADAQVQQNVHISGSDVSLSYANGTGSSVRVGMTTKTVRLSPTIHGVVAITLPSPSSQAVAVAARANITGGSNWPAQDANTGTLAATVAADVSPTSLAATTPAAIPASGYYLKEVATANHLYGLNQVRVIIFDFATLA